MLIAFAAPAAAFSGAGSGPQSLIFCDTQARLTAGQQDRLLQFGEVANRVLADAGAPVALVSRSGLNLARFGVRYSHAGLALRDSGHGTYAVRQLYYACDEGRPRLFDQGMGGFVSGTDDPRLGYLSILLLRGPRAEALARAALDRPAALSLVAGRYSANAYPFSIRYQNCNQWVAELMALAWSREPAAVSGERPREAAQAWLRQAGYAPPPVQVDSHLTKFAAGFVPWVHLDDHPDDVRYGLSFQVSLPTSLETFLRTQIDETSHVEMCHDERHVVVRRDGAPMGEGCTPGPGDEVLPL